MWVTINIYVSRHAFVRFAEFSGKTGIKNTYLTDQAIIVLTENNLVLMTIVCNAVKQYFM